MENNSSKPYTRSLLQLGILGIGSALGWLFLNKPSANEISVSDDRAPERTPFAFPPSIVEIENPNGVDCDLNFKTCTVDHDFPRLPCFDCLQYNYVCLHLPEALQLSDGNVLPPNESTSEGYCLPNPRNEEPNRWVTDPILTKLDEAGGWNFTLRCRYPQIFFQNDIFSDCRIFRDPCQPYGRLADPDGIIYNPSIPVWFDPFIQGRCVPEEGVLFVPVHDEIFGPRMEPARFQSLEPYALFPEGCNPKVHLDTGHLTVEELIARGVKPELARVLRTEMPATCIPAPCAICPLSGRSSERNFYDGEKKNCVCDVKGGFVPIYVDEDMLGNYVETSVNRQIPEPSNACLAIADGQKLRNVWVGGFVNPDRGSEELLEYDASTIPQLGTGSRPVIRYRRDYIHNAIALFVGDDQARFRKSFCLMGALWWNCLMDLWTNTNVNLWRNDKCSRDFNEGGVSWWETNRGRFVINTTLRTILCNDDVTSEDSATHGTVVPNPVAAHGYWHQLQAELQTDGTISFHKLMNDWRASFDLFDYRNLYLIEQ